MAYCSNCGYQLEENAKFCPACGTKTETSAETLAEQAPATEIPTHVESTIETPAPVKASGTLNVGMGNR